MGGTSYCSTLFPIRGKTRVGWVVCHGTLITLSAYPLIVLAFVSGPFEGRLVRPLVPVDGLRRRRALQPRVRRRVCGTRIERGTILLLGSLMVKFKERLQIFRSRIFLQVSTFTRVHFVQDRFDPMFNNTYRVKLCICREASGVTGFFIRVSWGLVLLFVRETRIIFVVFGREDIIMNEFGHVPIRVLPIAIIKSASVTRQTF